MAVSQNGWSANDRSVIETYTIGKSQRVSLRKGDAGFLLKHFADWFDANIRDIDANYNNGGLDDWGYAERPIRGATALSNHASGTALDINATEWPLGSEASVYLTAAEIAKVRAQLKVYEGALRWGGDYEGRKDPMHVEINANAETVARVAAKLRAPKPVPAPPKPPVVVKGNPALVKATQKALNFLASETDGVWGDQTDRGVNTIRNAINGAFPYGVKEAQTRVGTPEDGDWGPASKTALVQTIKELQAAWGATVDGQWGVRTEAAWTAARKANSIV